VRARLVSGVFGVSPARVTTSWRYARLRRDLANAPRTWLVTGVAGFIGSALLEQLLALGQNVVGLDNFSTGYQANLDDVLARRSTGSGTFRMIRGDIRDLEVCHAACGGVDYVLHQAALGSVPRSIDDPVTTNSVNVDGFLNVLIAARDAGARRVVYASSCAVYGDSTALPLREATPSLPLTPYAASKASNEVYAEAFGRTYDLPVTGLRYFNIFGARQDPDGAYAAVVPRWIAALLDREPCRIFGDGETSRDFCHVENVAQANLLAATDEDARRASQVYNVACGCQTTLNELFRMLRLGLAGYEPAIAAAQPLYGPDRRGDIRHSAADIGLIRQELNYEPVHTTAQGLGLTVEWYVNRSPQRASSSAPAVAGAH
jgi:UDP-N-acetylglucosamine 4-epimerase